MRFSDLPRILRFYILGHLVAAAPVLWFLKDLPRPENWLLVSALLLFTVLFATWKVELTVFQGRMTLVFAVVCLGLLLEGPIAATMCASLGGLISTFLNREENSWKIKLLRPRAYRIFFNVANTGLAAALSSFLFYWVSGSVPNRELGLIAALSAFTAGYFFLNTAGVAGACALQQRLNWWSVWQESFLWTAPGFFASASAAFGIQKAFAAVGALGLLFLPPLWLVYRSYRLYMDRIKQNTQHIEELNKLNQAIIASLATAIDAKDRYTCSHINRVQHYAISLAKAAGVTGPDMDAVATGALVHDIGKLGIPDHILGKPGKLTADEFKRIQTHVTIGADILSPIPFPFPVVDVVMTHHERWDGLGYPRGLKGEEIPIGGRIISLVDVFDALTSNRPYRKAMTHEEALAEVRANAGKQFDPRLVEIFARIQPKCAQEIAEMELAAQTQDAESTAPTDGSSVFSRISQAAAEMAAVSDVAHSLAEHETQEQIAATVVNRALALLPADTAVLYLRRPDEFVLDAVAVEGKYRGKLETMTIQMGEGVAGWVAANQQPRVNVSASLDIARRFTPEEAIELNAATAVPLVHGPESLGVLAVYTTGYSVLSDHHLRVLNIVAEHASSALQNIRRMEEHRELAHTDPLTGLVNSRGMVRHLDRLMFSHNRGDSNGEFSIVMLDVDRFKQVNDTLGHLRGDDLLREIGSVISGVSRHNDIACRYAGDEFVLLLPGANRDQAEEVAARLREAVDSIPTVEGRVKIGASVGVATFPTDGDHGKELIHVADRRMYEDKFHRRRTASLIGGEADDKMVAGVR